MVERARFSDEDSLTVDMKVVALMWSLTALLLFPSPYLERPSVGDLASFSVSKRTEPPFFSGAGRGQVHPRNPSECGPAPRSPPLFLVSGAFSGSFLLTWIWVRENFSPPSSANYPGARRFRAKGQRLSSRVVHEQFSPRDGAEASRQGADSRPRSSIEA